MVLEFKDPQEMEVEMFAGLADPRSSIQGVLTEEQFVRGYLPIFHDPELLQTKEEYVNFINGWIEIAGTPMKPVRVVDDNGKELYIVPPIYDYESLKTITDGEFSFMGAAFRAGELAKIHPNMGKQYLEDCAKKGFNIINNRNGRALNYARQWNEIYARYNLKQYEIGVEPKKALEAPTNPDYDDFQPL